MRQTGVIVHIHTATEPWVTLVHCVFNPHKWRKPLNCKQRCDYFRNFNTVITANVFFIPLQFTKTMDPGCKQYSQLDKDFWPLRNSAHHVHRDTVGGNETLLSYIRQRMHPKKGTKRRKNYGQKKEESSIISLVSLPSFHLPLLKMAALHLLYRKS